MSSAPDFYGITAPQILAFVLAVVASFFSARWGSAESRKQFSRKSEDDERAAAAELIPLLMKFALDCDKTKSNLSLYMNTGGQLGADEDPSSTTFDPKIHAAAARLGPDVTARAIKLEMTKFRAQEYIDDMLTDVDGDDEAAELNHQTLSFLALLSLRARYLADMAARKVGIPMKHPQSDMDRLLKEAVVHSSEIDSGDESSWY